MGEPVRQFPVGREHGGQKPRARCKHPEPAQPHRGASRGIVEQFLQQKRQPNRRPRLCRPVAGLLITSVRRRAGLCLVPLWHQGRSVSR
jgi:hypothetical protein